MKYLTSSLFLLCVMFSSLVHAQLNNPNKLPQCPKPDYSKSYDVGAGGRTEKWNNCLGRYQIELDTYAKGNVLDGEWHNGLLNGQATYYYLANNEFKGDIYVGDYKNGKMHGRGTYTFASGGKYIGELKEGKMDGRATIIYENGKKYVGDIKDNKLHGQGTLTFANGDKYMGEFKDDQKHGLGIFTFANGRTQEGIWEKENFIRQAIVNLPNQNKNVTTNTDRTDIDRERQQLAENRRYVESNPNNLPPCPKPDYSKSTDFERILKWNNCWGKYKFEFINKDFVIEGEISNGLLNGVGSFKNPNGDIYTGMFKNILRHGHGTYSFTNGNKYDGEWKDDKQNGYGTYTMSNGDRYTGEFKDDKFHGQGTLTLAKGNKYVGEFKNGKLHGQGTFTFAHGDIYIGEHMDDKMNGLGTYTIANGDQYVGEFKDHKYHGQGIFTFTNGRTQEGIWESNNFIREAKVNLPNLNKNVATNADLTKNKNINDLNVQRNQLDFDSLGSSELQICQGTDKNKWYKCFGILTEAWGSYVGEFKDGNFDGKGTATYNSGTKYAGEFRDGKANGFGKYKNAKAEIYIGEWDNWLMHGKGMRFDKDGVLIEEGIFQNSKLIKAEKTGIDQKFVRSDEKRIKYSEINDKRNLNLIVTNTQPNSDGLFFIDIKTNADTASLLIDGKEEGGKSDGNYTLKRIARAGQSSSFKIVATDIYGNTDTKTINVTRTISEAKATYADLNPTNIKRRSDRDAVAIIIGISDYKNLPKADFANDDARVFYDYAIRALSIKPDNIKLLVDGDASEVGIYKAFKTWLPSKVRSSTDVYVFYSGHGLPTSDGKGLYLLPQQTDRDLISKTAIQMQEVISDIQSTKPKSVTLFLDACYSGQSRTGETLIASARPIAIRSESRFFPENFTVITASQNDQISSSNPDLKHGIFSYYLMRGMEGDADTDKDGKITLGEMQSYLVENVGRQAGMMNRKQEPQLIGDANRVLVGR